MAFSKLPLASMHTQVSSGPAPRSWSQLSRLSCPSESFETLVLAKVSSPLRKASSKSVLPTSMPTENANLLELLGALSMLVNTGSSPKMLFGVHSAEKGDENCSLQRAHRCLKQLLEARGQRFFPEFPPPVRASSETFPVVPGRCPSCEGKSTYQILRLPPLTVRRSLRMTFG